MNKEFQRPYSGQSKYPEKGTYDKDIIKPIVIEPAWITFGIDSKSIEKIEEIGKEIASPVTSGSRIEIENVTSTQLNNIFRNFKGLLQIENSDRDKEFAQTWINFAYITAKGKKDKKTKLVQLFEGFSKCLKQDNLISQVGKNPFYLENFIKIWEALLSYHNYYEQKK